MKYFYYFPEEKKLVPRDESEEKGVLVILGENQKENGILVKECDQGDHWFHVENHPSGHAVYTGDDISNDAITRVALLVKEQSKLKNLKRVSVIYTQLKNVKSLKTPGKVMLTKSPNIIKV
jgi:predicted ribosome quality control (RQC) complex YloA/Tae2 family protein